MNTMKRTYAAAALFVALLPLTPLPARGAEAADEEARAPAISTDPALRHAITLDGEPFFPIGLYSVRPEDMEEVKAAGFNLVHTYTGCCSEKDLKAHEAFLDEADRLGLKTFLYPFYPPEQVDTAPAEELAETVRRRARHPSLLFWYTVDEPDVTNRPADLCLRVSDFVKAADPAHPTALVVASAWRFEEFMPTADWFMTDPYPLPFYPIRMVRDHVSKAVETAAGGPPARLGRPVLAVIQAHDQTPYFNVKLGDQAPSEKEIYNMACQAVAVGAKGVIFWALHASRYDLMAVPGQWEALKRVGADLSRRAHVLILPDSDVEIPVLPDDAPVDLLLKRGAGAWYLLVVNYTRKSFELGADLSALKPAPAGAVEDAAGGPAGGPAREFGYDEKTGKLTLNMSPLDVWWFRLNPGD